MIDVSRRSFLGGVLAFTAVAAFGPPSFGAPRIYGDGFHDDWEGLQAAMFGEPFAADEEVVRRLGGSLWISGGQFLLSQPLVFGRDSVVTGTHFEVMDSFAGKAVLIFDGRSRGSCYRNGCVDARNCQHVNGISINRELIAVEDRSFLGTSRWRPVPNY